MADGSSGNQWLNGRFCVMRYASVESTVAAPRRWRRRLGFLVWARWRLPAWWNRTLPVPVILNRLDTDFFVLMPLGRRINLNFSIAKEHKLYVATGVEASAIFELIKSQHADGRANLPVCPNLVVSRYD